MIQIRKIPFPALFGKPEDGEKMYKGCGSGTAWIRKIRIQSVCKCMCQFGFPTFHFLAASDPNPDPILQNNKDPDPVKIRILPDSARMYLYQIRDQCKYRYMPRLRKQLRRTQYFKKGHNCRMFLSEKICKTRTLLYCHVIRHFISLVESESPA
jgi:hypothetical protein